MELLYYLLFFPVAWAVVENIANERAIWNSNAINYGCVTNSQITNRYYGVGSQNNSYIIQSCVRWGCDAVKSESCYIMVYRALWNMCTLTPCVKIKGSKRIQFMEISNSFLSDVKSKRARTTKGWSLAKHQLKHTFGKVCQKTVSP